MKSILYVGATLMIGASIYGFVDYRKTSRNKQFSTMYETKEPKEPVVVVSKEEPAKKEEVIASKEEKKEAPEKVNTATTGNTRSKYTTVKKKKFNTKLFSRSRPPMPVEKVIVEVEETKKTETKEQ